MSQNTLDIDRSLLKKVKPVILKIKHVTVHDHLVTHILIEKYAEPYQL